PQLKFVCLRCRRRVFRWSESGSRRATRTPRSRPADRSKVDHRAATNCSLDAAGDAVSALLVKGCVGQDSNLRTPEGRDLESLAVDRAWLPTRGVEVGGPL